MSSLQEALAEIEHAVEARLGRVAWPEMPADPFAAIVLVFLEYSIGDEKAGRVLEALRSQGILDPGELAKADRSEITQVARATGVVLTSKTVAVLQRLGTLLLKRVDLNTTATEVLRDDILQINGIGQATADAILLQALSRPVFPVDRASFRIFVRHGWLDPTADYEEARGVLESLAPEAPLALANWSTWLDQIGSKYCRPSVAKCEQCPLRPFLPQGGPIDPTS